MKDELACVICILMFKNQPFHELAEYKTCLINSLFSSSSSLLVVAETLLMSVGTFTGNLLLFESYLTESNAVFAVINISIGRRHVAMCALQ